MHSIPGLCMAHGHSLLSTESSNQPFCHSIWWCDDVVHDLSDAKFFIGMDLDCGYNQIKVHPDSWLKFAFFAPDSYKYQFHCMPFGPQNSAPIFMCMMEDLAVVLNVFVGTIQVMAQLEEYLHASPGSKVFVDDVFLYASSTEALLLYFQSILTVLQHHCTSVKLKKCILLLQTQVCWDWHLSRGQSTCPSKFPTFEQLHTPHTTGDLQTLIGLFSFYSKFLEHFEVCIGPWQEVICLTETQSTEKNHIIPTLLWTPVCQDLLMQLQHEIINGPLLAWADSRKCFHLKSDWSHLGMGTIFLQPKDMPATNHAMEDEKSGSPCLFEKTLGGPWLWPITFISRRCGISPEKPYHSYVGEAGTGVWVIKKFWHYYGAKNSHGLLTVVACISSLKVLTHTHTNSCNGGWPCLDTHSLLFIIQPKC